jgi:predicted component of type VI protein secretion system
MGQARTVFFDAASLPAAAVPARPAAVKLIMLGPDGHPLGERLLEGESLVVGRSHGAPWDDDAYLDPHHCTLSPHASGLRVEDHGSLNGVFMKLEGRVELRDGDQFRAGQELLEYHDVPEPDPAADGTERMGSPNPGYWGRVAVLVDPGRPCAAWPIANEGVTIGREGGDITFPTDGYVSGTHCRILGDDSGIYLEDLGSSNGTYVRMRSGDVVPFDRLILVGQKLFRVARP